MIRTSTYKSGTSPAENHSGGLEFLHASGFVSSKGSKSPEEQPPPELNIASRQKYHLLDISLENFKKLNSEKPKSIMNQLSTLEGSRVTEIPLGSKYDDLTRKWQPSKGVHLSEGEFTMARKKNFYSYMVMVLLLVFGAFNASAQADVSLRKTIDNSMPALGGTVKYTLWAINKGNTAATNVKIKDSYPSGSVSLILGSVTPTGGASFSATPSSIDWSIPSLAPNDSVKLEFSGNVLTRGVIFNTAEVVSMSNMDADSSPGNGNLLEDDITSACFSVPLIIYPGDEFVVSVPSGYKEIVWFRNGVPVTSTSIGAKVNADSTLSVMSAGTYTFSTKVNGTCPASGCCDMKVVPGEFGSLGNYVWEDTNKDGLQSSDETPIANVKVYLLDGAGNKLDSTTTNASGFYIFNNLLHAETYKVKFVAPTGRTFTSAFVPGATSNSDAGLNGETYPVTISVYDAAGNLRPALDSLRNNPNLDAGITPVPVACDRIVSCVIKPNSNICMGDTAYLSATSALGGKVKWYLSATDDEAIATTTSGSQLMVFPTTTTTYYVAMENVSDNCPGLPRKSVTVIVNAKPATPTCGGMAENNCAKGEGFVNLNTYIQSLISTPGGVFEWHTGWNPSSPIVANPTNVTASGKYYLFEKSATGCFSNAALLQVNIKDCSCDTPYGVSAGIDQTICEGSTASAIATKTGATGSVLWSTTGTGTFSSASSASTTYTPSAADILAGNVVLTVTTDDPDGQGPCKPVSDALILTISKTPMTPYNVSCADSVLCKGEKTKLFGFSSPGSQIKWYTTATGGTPIATTANATGYTISPLSTTTYYAEACIGSCVNPVRVPVTVNVKNCLTDLAINKSITPAGPYTIGQTVTYAVTVTNNGPINATLVNMLDVLPSQLTYVSSAPAGYNNTTGVWPIGNLTVGSSQTILMQATINASGTIVNTSRVTSPDNDPALTANDVSTVTIVVEEKCDVTTPIVACTNTQICFGETISCTAINCNGTVVWSIGMTGSSITFVPTASMSLTAVCKKSERCISPISNALNINVEKIQPVLIVSDVTKICGGKATLIAQGCAGGTIIWSDGQFGSSISVSPSISTTYTAYCRLGKCRSDESNSITITNGANMPAPTVSASATSICAGEPVTLTAANCNGTISWSDGQTGASVVVSPSASTSYMAYCVDGGCKSQPSTPVAIAVMPRPTLTLSATAMNVCAGESTTITASGCTGTVSWSTGATGNSITVSPTSNTNYSATCSTNTTCKATASIAINAAPRPERPVLTCGKEVICPGESLLFTAHGCAGTVNWSTGATGTTMTVNPTVTTTYTATCTVNGCVSAPSLDAVITVIKPTIAINGPTTVCAGESITLTAEGCLGAIAWSTGAATKTITVSPTASTTYTVTCMMDQCNGSANLPVTVTPGATPTISGGNITVCSGIPTTLTASGCTSYLWSNGATTSTLTVSPTATTTYNVKCSNSCSTTAISTLTVTDGEKPTVSGSTAHCGANPVTLTASGCTSGYLWSTGATTASISVTPNATTSYEVKCSNTCGRATQHTITINSPTTPEISANKTEICPGTSVTLNAANCNGTVVWSSGQTGATITVNPTVNTTYSAVCSIGQDCKSGKSNEITVRVNGLLAIPVISCSATRICVGESIKLLASNCSGTVLWSTGQTGAEISISPSTTTSYSAKCKVGDCESESSAVATINVGPPTPPIVKCDLTQVCAGSSITVTANNCDGKVIWSNGQIGSVITTTITQTTAYSAICEGGNGCKSAVSNTLTVSVFGTPITAPTTKDLVNTCPGVTVDLSTGVTSSPNAGGTFVFRTGPTVTSTAVANPSAAGAGKYYVFEMGGSNCSSAAGIINVVITTCTNIPNCATSPATANAGSNAEICIEKDSYTLNGSFGGAATSATWTSNGTGRFENSKDPKSKYFYTLEDIMKGEIKFTLTTNDPDNEGSCTAASSSVTVKLNGIKFIPTITSNKSTTICNGDEVILTASQEGNYRYKWSNGATTRSITVKDGGKYSVKLVDANGCCSISSAETSVNIISNIPAISVLSNISNECPSTTVNLTNAVRSAVTTGGGVFEFRTGSSPSSNIVANTTVGSGTYYVFEKSTVGCYSPGSRIDVSINTCNVQSGDADLSISITSDRPEFNLNETVNFNVFVRNNGAASVTNGTVTVTLPAGVQFVSGAGYTKVNDQTYTVGIGSLALNGSTNIPFVGKITTLGDKEVMAKITASSQPDPIASNNTSMVTVSCIECTVSFPSIGLALKADTVRKANGSYDIKYTAIIKNNGNVDVKALQITDTLSKVFALPTGTTFTVVSAPMVNAGSQLVVNAAFNGKTDPRVILGTDVSKIVQGKTDTVMYTVNVVLPTSTTSAVFNSNATASGTTTGNIAAVISDISNAGTNPARAGSTPTEVRLNAAGPVITPCVDVNFVSRAAADTVKQANGSYNVKYCVIVKNCGNVSISNVKIVDSLNKAFGTVPFTMVGAPTLNAGSTITLATGYNGGTQPILVNGGSLAVGKSDTVCYTVNLVKGTANGPWVNTASASATGNGTNVTDTGDQTLRFNTPATAVGVAKNIRSITPVAGKQSTFDIIYDIKVQNFGSNALTKVQVEDDLGATFGDKVLIDSAKVISLTSPSFKLDSTYTGRGVRTKLLKDTLSTLAVGASNTIGLKIRVNTKDTSAVNFNNTAMAKVAAGTVNAEDASQEGTNADPDNDGDPKNNNIPTKTALNGAPSLLGISKKADTTKASIGYDVKYTIIVKNYSTTALTNVQVLDSLKKAFADTSTVVTIKTQPSLGSGSTLALNTGFGLTNSKMLLPATSTLAAGKSDTIRFTVNVVNKKASAQTYCNQATISANAGTDTYSDISVAGLNPDLNANTNPGDDQSCTDVTIPASNGTGTGEVTIPAGFSPNSDASSLNETWALSNVDPQDCEVKIYNRWGTLVYYAEKYDNGFKGQSNQGVRFGSESLPDGTYFYCVVCKTNGKQYVGPLTIAR